MLSQVLAKCGWHPQTKLTRNVLLHGHRSPHGAARFDQEAALLKQFVDDIERMSMTVAYPMTLDMAP